LSKKKQETKKEEDQLLFSDLLEKLKDLPDFLRRLKRGIQGLPLDEDIYSGLLNVKDLRERTRVTEFQISSHSYMRIMNKVYPDIFEVFEQIPEMEDTYYIAKDGEQRKEAIFMQRARSTVQLQGVNESLMLPNIETKPPETKKKGRIFNRS